MISSSRALVGAGIASSLLALALLSRTSAGAQQPMPHPPGREVLVVNGPMEPVPITGTIDVGGATTVNGTVGAAQSGDWTVGIDSNDNEVRVRRRASFYYDSDFGGFNDGETLELGPFDLSDMDAVRLVARGVNGVLHVEVIAETPTADFTDFDVFSTGTEDTSETTTRVYELPPRSLRLRLTESGPGGTNYHVLLIGR